MVASLSLHKSYKIVALLLNHNPTKANLDNTLKQNLVNDLIYTTKFLVVLFMYVHKKNPKSCQFNSSL